jgi:ubiquinone/menaquinone biosynthesis C-methylase UbiE
MTPLSELAWIDRHYPEYRFGGFTDVDGTIAFYTRICALLQPLDVVLDIGCGRGSGAEDPVRARRELRQLRGRCDRVIGIDLDPVGRTNPTIDEFRLISAKNWPVESESINLAFADFVLEHVAEPDHFFAECRRVVRRGGYLCIRTSNVLSYFGLVSRFVPNRRHLEVLRVVQPHRHAEDVFPTAYKANTQGKLRQLLRRHGFDACVYGYEAEPSYVPPTRSLLYRLAVWHARYAPRRFRIGLFAFGQRPLTHC